MMQQSTSQKKLSNRGNLHTFSRKYFFSKVNEKARVDRSKQAII
jgi:hypothetical protein